MLMQTIKQSLFLLLLLVFVTCIIYPGVLWIIGQGLFPFQANGSLLYDANHRVIGSKLIAQGFTQDQYFHPRPSAASYDASASASSALAPSNYALRDRVARSLGPLVKYQDGKPVAPDIEKWFQADRYQGEPHIVSQWASLHASLAQAWVSADLSHSAYVDTWMKTHTDLITQWKKNNPNVSEPKAADVAVLFFQHFSNENPGKFPIKLTKIENGKTFSEIEAMNTGTDIQAIFFDMWLQNHSDTKFQMVPADFVMSSASGLDPDISVQNAEFQLDRVANAWATTLKRNPKDLQSEIEKIILSMSHAPLFGLFGEANVNVLELNVALHNQYAESRS